jgi:hypothetical protein
MNTDAALEHMHFVVLAMIENHLGLRDRVAADVDDQSAIFIRRLITVVIISVLIRWQKYVGIYFAVKPCHPIPGIAEEIYRATRSGRGGILQTRQRE